MGCSRITTAENRPIPHNGPGAGIVVLSMNRVTRHARGLLIAVAVLALTAGVAFARAADPAAGTMPDAASSGLERATEASGVSVPVAAPANDQDQAEDADGEPAENEPAENAEGDHPENHGAVVSEAAQGATPADATNHGQYVRTVATDNHGQATSSEHRQDGDKGAKPNR